MGSTPYTYMDMIGIRKILKFIFPDNLYCFACQSMIDDSRPYGICDYCMGKFHWANKKICEKCGKLLEEESIFEKCKDCRENPRFFEKGYTCLMYGLHEKEIIRKFKYSGAGYMKDKLGDLLYDRLRVELEEGFNPDFIVPVPIHRKRQQKRGYNQAGLLAGRLSDISGIPLLDNFLLRIKNTPPLSSLSREERIVRMEDVFAVVNTRSQCIIDKTILLLDDIFTTGSTVDECSSVLLKEGAKEVHVLTLMAGGSA